MKDIKKGYKQTEFGVIPVDWEVKIIESLAVLKAGKSVSLKDNFGGRYPCFGGNGVRDYVSFYSHDGSFPIIGRQGELCGNVSYADGKFYATEHAIVSKSKKNIDSKWLYYSLINANLNQYATGCAQPGLSVNNINLINMCCPSYVEQCAISTALSDIDSLILSINKKIEKKKAIKQGLMQQLLTGKKRLPGFSGKWLEQKLGELFQVNAGGDLQINYYSNTYNDKYKYPIYSNSLENKGLYGYTSMPRYSANSITITGRGSIGHAEYREFEFDAIIRILILFPLCKANCKYITYLINFLNPFYCESTGIPQLTVPQVENLEINMLVDFEEQTAITTILSDIDKDISATEASRDKYIQIKSAMMQQLLTGKIRLVEPLQQNLCSDESKVIPIDAHIVGGHIIKKLYASKGWGKTKLQKSLHLIGYCCQLDFGNKYIRNTAGPDDEKLMSYIDSKLIQYNQIVKEKEILSNGYTHYLYKPTTRIAEIEQAFNAYSVGLQHNIDSLLDKIFNMDLAGAEIVSTLYAVWNNRIIKGQEINDNSLLSDFYDWSPHKSKFKKDLVLENLNYMRNSDIIPVGWGRYIDKK